ncbi:MAG: iron-containing alcohol dehydrogenase, partial [Nitrospinota bacterium]|nr:iron-containing alcohol dehydrogenase [Nitrospinota bacterium]
MTNTPPFQTPDAILSGAGSSTQIGPEVLKIGIHRPLVVTDPGVAGSGILDRVVSGLEEAGLKVGDFVIAVDGEKLTASAPEHYEELPTLIRTY